MVRPKKKPGAVSGPGRMSERTDLTPAGGSQPVRPVPGGNYGDRAASVRQQGAAPMAAPAGLTEGVFTPTQRPTESPTAAAPQAMTDMSDPDALLRAMVSKYPFPDLLRLLDRRPR